MKNLQVPKSWRWPACCAPWPWWAACCPFPVLGSKCAPVQHMVNVLCAVVLGPWYGVGVAFVASLVRNLLGLGSLLAFPGSMCGALLCGLVYWKTKNLPATLVGEVFGTGIIGGLLSYPIAHTSWALAGLGLHRLYRARSSSPPWRAPSSRASSSQPCARPVCRVLRPGPECYFNKEILPLCLTFPV